MNPVSITINQHGNGESDTGRWPSGNDPIIYIHFAYDQNHQSPPFNPTTLLYIGERKTESNFKTGFTRDQGQYPWLKEFSPKSKIRSYYWTLDRQLYANDDRRKTLECLIYNDIFQRYQMQSGVLRFNGGMQIMKRRMKDLRVMKQKYILLAEMTDLGI